MTRAVSPIDIGAVPELVRMAEEVRRTRAPRLLRHGGEVIALLAPAPASAPDPTPAAPRKRQPRHAPAAIAAQDTEFAAAAGSWRGLVDGEQLKADLKAARGSKRPRATV